MAYTHVSRLTTTSDQVFETVEEFIDFHGPLGENHPLVGEFIAEIEEGGQSIIRTMVYNHLSHRAEHKIVGGFDGEDNVDLTFAPEGKEFTVELVSISE